MNLFTIYLLGQVFFEGHEYENQLHYYEHDTYAENFCYLTLVLSLLRQIRYYA